MKYHIQHRIMTLAENAIMNKDAPQKPGSFLLEDVTFSHWDFNLRDGWLEDAWMAESIIDATNLREALKIFFSKINRIIPRTSLIVQCYIQYWTEPFLVLKEGSDVAFFRYTKDSGPVGLMFTENHRDALALLLSNCSIPNEFFYYWNDAVNAVGYSSKLLLMFSAIEALVKKNGKKDWQLLEQILGKQLKVDLFGQSNTGLRHRLVHGEYFNAGDSGNNYLDLVHKKIITYFNDAIFGRKLLDEDVVQPQRHFFGNRQECKTFIKSNGTAGLTLKEVLSDFNENDINKLKHYAHVSDDLVTSAY
jgi:hypothetical protein